MAARRIVIFGNSGSGKSTLARRLAAAEQLAHLDLDTVAWKPTAPPAREAIATSKARIDAFLGAGAGWVVEGCYADLIELVLDRATELIFLNPGAETCATNCSTRPWEPHKYATPEEQDANLEMLVQWVRDYETRTDEFSLRAHRALFDAFAGTKIEHRSNDRRG